MDSGCTNGIDTGFVALGYAKVAVLGVVQGITELMPISSTAHMRIVPALLGWPDPGSAFSAAMQLAALAAVISYFWRDVWGLVFGSLSAIARRDYYDRSFVLAVGIVIGTIPIGIAGLALAKTLNIGLFRRRLEYPELKRAVREQQCLFGANEVLIEDKASGTQLIQELIADGCHAVMRYQPTCDKIMRLHALTPMIENGFVRIPETASRRVL